MLKIEWKYSAIAAAFNFVGRKNRSPMGNTSPVPLNFLPSAVTPLSFQAKAECPTANPKRGTVYVSPVSPAVIFAQSHAVVFRVSEELHMCFNRELALTAACKLTLVLLQGEWPSAPGDQAHVAPFQEDYRVVHPHEPQEAKRLYRKSSVCYVHEA